MNVTSHRNTLIGLTIVMLAGAGIAVAWSMSSLDRSVGQTVRDNGNANADAPPPELEPSFDPTIAARSLRGPLYDPPPPQPRPAPPPQTRPTAPPPQPKLELILVGTIIDSAQSLAIIADAAGNFDVKAEGESLELSPAGITIEDVKPEQVTLNVKGRSTTVTLERQKSSGAGGNRGNNRRRNRP